MLIGLVEYATRHGKDPKNARKMAAAGRFTTARKTGRNWVVDSEEPWPDDQRVKSGKYIGWREKHGKREGI